jgi:hypothetical protein
LSKYRTFKGTERAISRILGGRRTGQLGGADVTASWLTAEVKHRANLPAWLMDAMAQAVRHASNGQLPVVVLHTQGTRHNGDLVVMRLSDFVDWFGGRRTTPRPRPQDAGTR